MMKLKIKELKQQHKYTYTKIHYQYCIYRTVNSALDLKIKNIVFFVLILPLLDLSSLNGKYKYNHTHLPY